MLSDDSRVDVSYIDISLKKIGLGGSDPGDDEDPDVARRKRSHAERLSHSSYTSEQLFSDLGRSSYSGSE